MKQKHFKKTNTWKRVINTSFTLLAVVVLLCTMLFSALTLLSSNGVTQIFGYLFSAVQSGSMSGTFEIGDVIISRKAAPNALAVGDVISFYYEEPSSGAVIIVTHRIISIDNSTGSYSYQTRGDAVTDAADFQTVSPGDVISRYTGKRLSGLGKLIDFIRSKTGFFCCILLPLLLFLVYQGYQFVAALHSVYAARAQKRAREKRSGSQLIFDIAYGEIPESSVPAEPVQTENEGENALLP